MRKVPFINGEHYHVYNRGVDKRNIFLSEKDIERFLQSMEEFNVINPIGSLYQNSFVKRGGLGCQTAKPAEKSIKLVEFVTYCINPNHYHFILRQVSDGGISEFMKRLGGGYTWFFNNKYNRNGVLFQGKFKAIHIDSNEYLLHLSAYVNLNYQVHNKLGGPTAKLTRTSWNEYMRRKNKNEKQKDFCEKSIVLGQFNNLLEYQKFAESSLQDILKKKKNQKEFNGLLLE